MRYLKGHINSQIIMITDVRLVTGSTVYVDTLFTAASPPAANRVLSSAMVNCISSGIRESINANT